MTDGTVGALAILILIFATSTIVFFVKNILDRRISKVFAPPPLVSKRKEEFYVIKQSSPPVRKVRSPAKYSVVSSNDIFELSELDDDKLRVTSDERRIKEKLH